MKLSALMSNKWFYVTIPEGCTWQVTPQRQASGYQVRVYRGSGKGRQIIALFHVDRIVEENTVEFDYAHPLNDKARLLSGFSPGIQFKGQGLSRVP